MPTGRSRATRMPCGSLLPPFLFGTRLTLRRGPGVQQDIDDSCGCVGLGVLDEGAGFHPPTISPHGLRAGLFTEAATRGASLPKMLEISRHKQIDTLTRYLHATNLFAEPAAKALL